MKLRLPFGLPRGAAVFTPHESDRVQRLAGRPLASFGRRAVAFWFDFVVASVATGVLTLPVLYALGRWGYLDHDVKLVFKPFDNWYSVLAMVAYSTLAHYWGKGRTLGKRLMKIRVVSLEHEHLSLWHCFERALAYGASALELGFGFFQYFLHPHRQTVHDRIAETIVVDERAPR